MPVDPIRRKLWNKVVPFPPDVRDVGLIKFEEKTNTFLIDTDQGKFRARRTRMGLKRGVELERLEEAS